MISIGRGHLGGVIARSMTHFPHLAHTLNQLGPRIHLQTQQLDHQSTPYNSHKKATATAWIKVYNANQVSQVMKWAAAHSVEIIPQGGNTSLVEGATPFHLRSPILILSMGNSKTQVSNDLSTLTVGAGTTLQDAQIASQKVGRCLPMTYGSKGTATLGGAISTRAMGMGKGTPQITQAVTIVDGSGHVHHIQTPTTLEFPATSVLPGTGATWPFGNQGYLGMVTECTFRLEEPNRQTETIMLAGNCTETLLAIKTKITAYFTKIGLDAQIQMAELMYQDAIQNVFKIHGDPFGGTSFKRYMLIQMGTPSTHYSLNTSLTECLTSVDPQNFECVIASSRAQQKKLIQIRESISDAARAACQHWNCTPIPMDISCRIEQLPKVLNHLDQQTKPHRHHVFGHLQQGDGTHAVIHYNLGAVLHSKTSPDIEEPLLESLYSQFKDISHSGEHGGLGLKTLGQTVKYSPLETLHHFDQQCQRFNPASVLQTSRLTLFRSLLQTKIRDKSSGKIT